MWSGRRLGIVSISSTVTIAIVIAPNANTARQPKWSATKLATGRDSRMPSKRPLMIVPTTRPRDSLGARCAASGISNCTATELKPTISDTTRNTPGSRTPAASARLAIDINAVTTISFLFSTRSPSGTRKNRPAA